MRRGILALTVGLAAVPASAAAAPSTTVTASKSVAKSCQTRLAGKAAATERLRVTSSAEGLVRARLRSRGDWDLAVFDARTKRLVAASAAFRGNELAEGYVTKGQRLIVKACRFAGRSSRARVSVSFIAQRKPGNSGATQVVEVSTPTHADKQWLQRLGLDLTEHGDADSVDVVLYGDQDAQKLR